MIFDDDLLAIDFALANHSTPIEQLETPVQETIREILEMYTEWQEYDANDPDLELTICKLRRLYFSFFLKDFGGTR